MARLKSFTFKPAGVRDAAPLAALHTAVAEDLTARHGNGPWSAKTTEKGVLFALRNMSVFVVRDEQAIIATVRLASRKPWAIDTAYFTPGKKPLYLTHMAVTPERQRQGIGRWCLEQAVAAAKKLSADAIRLDAYDAKAGAYGFYASCGFTERGRATYRQAALIYYELLIP